jgi:hypothetical protein
MTISKSFKTIDKEVMKNIPKGDNGFDLKKAGLYGVHEFPDGEAIAIKESENEDVYELLADYSSVIKLIPYDGFGIITVGWAAPIKQDEEINEDIRPSQHPERTRVRLFVYCDKQGNVSSSVRFKDGREMQYDENQATGSLKDAMTCLFKDKKAATRAFKELSTK